MKKMIGIVVAALCFSVFASPVFAGGNDFGNKKDQKHYKMEKKKTMLKKDKHSKRSKVTSVPEIDAASAGISLALIAGIVAIGRERRRKS